MPISRSLSNEFNAYIDGFNLYKGTLETRPSYKWLDLRALCEAHMKGLHLNKVYYFTAPVKSRFPGDRASDRQHSYLRALNYSGVEIILGGFRKNIDWKRFASPEISDVIEPSLFNPFGLVGSIFKRSFALVSPDSTKAKVLVFGEKGSDVNLASYMLRDVYMGAISNALVISADTDQTTPIQFARNFGVNVNVLLPGIGAKSDKLRAAANRADNLDINLLSKCQLPKVIFAPNGRQIHRPKEWH